jgi:hypothetical protein
MTAVVYTGEYNHAQYMFFMGLNARRIIVGIMKLQKKICLHLGCKIPNNHEKILTEYSLKLILSKIKTSLTTSLK